MRGELRAVSDALIRAALEVFPLEEDDLERKTQIVFGSNVRKHQELNAEVSSVMIIIVNTNHTALAEVMCYRILVHIQ